MKKPFDIDDWVRCNPEPTRQDIEYMWRMECGDDIVLHWRALEALHYMRGMAEKAGTDPRDVARLLGLNDRTVAAWQDGFVRTNARLLAVFERKKREEYTQLFYRAVAAYYVGDLTTVGGLDAAAHLLRAMQLKSQSFDENWEVQEREALINHGNALRYAFSFAKGTGTDEGREEPTPFRLSYPPHLQHEEQL